jgi:hypothetical protein
MARLLRLEFPGAAYPVPSRGNARQAVFPGMEGTESYLGVLSSKKPMKKYILPMSIMGIG